MNIINNSNYVDKAEEVIKKLNSKKYGNGNKVLMVTTSKIRNLLAMTADIYNDVLNQGDEKLSENIKGRIEYLRVRFIYEAGREQRVKDLVSEAKILEILGEIAGSRKSYILFSHYMEALVAFRKYYDGKSDD